MNRALQRVPVLEVAFIIIALAALVALAVLGQAPREGAQLDSYSTYDAASGGYRALYELLQREGLRVDRFEQRPAFLDGSVDTLVYAEPLAFDPRQILPTQNDAFALEDWVRNGGRLLYFGFDDAAARAKILALPYSTAATSRQRRAVLDTGLRAAGVTHVGTVAAPVRWKLPHGHARALFNDGRGATIVTYPFGRGTVTAVIDEALLDNAHLAMPDRPRLAVALAMPHRAGGVVSFDETIHGYLTPEHWWQIVPRPFVVALGIAAIALLVALAGAMLRLGPPVLPRPRDDRTTADFIDALSALLEHGKAARTAIEDAVTSTTRSVARGLGAGDDAAPAQVAARIESAQARADFREMQQLIGTGGDDSEDLVRAVALAQRLRKEFAPHGR